MQIIQNVNEWNTKLLVLVAVLSLILSFISVHQYLDLYDKVARLTLHVHQKQLSCFLGTLHNQPQA